MKCAADFRCIAKNALSGRWWLAIVAGLIASLLGAGASGSQGIKLDINDSDFNINLNLTGQQASSSGGVLNEQLAGFLAAGIVVIVLVALALAVVQFILGSIVGVGYAKFNLDLVDRQKEPKISTLFGFFKYWKTIIPAGLLQALYVFLWSLLFVIPGIIASYSYAMTSYILAEYPGLSASEALEQSKEMMYGHRWRLFCLHFSFIGWELLCILTLGVGNLWLAPYKKAAETAFYREVSGTEYLSYSVAPPQG